MSLIPFGFFPLQQIFTDSCVLVTYISDVDFTERYKTILYLHPVIQSTGQGISVGMLVFKILFTVVPLII